MKKLKARSPYQIITVILLIVICIAWLFPLYFILMTSLRTDASFRQETFSEAFGILLFPKAPTFDTYKTVLDTTTGSPVLQWFLNSLTVAVSSTILTVFVSAMAAFGYARMQFKGKNILFSFLMFTMMIPGVINLVPSYKIVSMLGLKNNLLALILPGLSGVGNVFLIRQFFYSVPKDFDEAAKIDGAGYIRIFFQILLPQIVPVLMVVALNSFLGSWNDLLWPMIVMDDTSKRTLTAGLSVINGVYDTEYASKMASTVISAVPVLLIYIFAQKYLLQGISLSSGVKG